MLIFNALQSALAAYVLWLAASRMRHVQLRLRIDAMPLGRAVARRVRAGELAAARAIVAASAPSAFQRVASPLLAGAPPAEAEALVDEAYADVEVELERGIFALRALASIAVAAGFCGAAFAMASFVPPAAAAGTFHGGALEGAMGTMALGLLAAFPALSAHRILRRARVDIAADVDRAVAEVEAATRAAREPADPGDEGEARNQRRAALSQDA